MNKTIGIGIIALLVVAGGGLFFLYQQAQADVKDLNASLPEGIRVSKSLFGDEYTVVNDIDGYSFKTPSEWAGLREVLYTPKEDVEGYMFSTLEITGIAQFSTLSIVNKIDSPRDIVLESWVRSLLESFGDTRKPRAITIGSIDVVMVEAGENVFDFPIYFFHKGSSVYAISNSTEMFIEENILSGSW